MADRDVQALSKSLTWGFYQLAGRFAQLCPRPPFDAPPEQAYRSAMLDEGLESAYALRRAVLAMSNGAADGQSALKPTVEILRTSLPSVVEAVWKGAQVEPGVRRTLDRCLVLWTLMARLERDQVVSLPSEQERLRRLIADLMPRLVGEVVGDEGVPPAQNPPTPLPPPVPPARLPQIEEEDEVIPGEVEKLLPGAPAVSRKFLERSLKGYANQPLQRAGRRGGVIFRD